MWQVQGLGLGNCQLFLSCQALQDEEKSERGLWTQVFTDSKPREAEDAHHLLYLGLSPPTGSFTFITKKPSPDHKGKTSTIPTQIFAKDAQRDF